MTSFYHLYRHINQYGLRHKSIYTVSLMIFFWAIFDGIISYLSPILITNGGLSKTMMGIILGSSSVAGALFDFLLSKFLRDTSFRRIYLLMFIVSFAQSFVLYKASTIFLYLLAMALWGFYYDLTNFGNFDFVGRRVSHAEHASSFGVIGVFKALGYLLAPILAGLVIGSIIDVKPFLLAWLFLVFAFVLFLILIYLTKKSHISDTYAKIHKNPGVLFEMGLWEKVGFNILPALLLSMLINIYDSFFWTIGPILSESFKSLHPFNGLFLTIYTLPPLIIGWFVGYLTSKFGKKRTGFLAFAAGSTFLVAFSFLNNAFLILGATFISSSLVSLSWSSVNGSYADLIEKSPSFEKEIQGLADFFTNLGYVLGPMTAGFLADQIGNQHTFTVLGIFGFLFSIALLKSAKKEIQVRV